MQNYGTCTATKLQCSQLYAATHLPQHIYKEQISNQQNSDKPQIRARRSVPTVPLRKRRLYILHPWQRYRRPHEVMDETI